MELELIFPVIDKQWAAGYTVLEFDMQRLVVELQAVVKGSRISHRSSSSSSPPSFVCQAEQQRVTAILLLLITIVVVCPVVC